MAFVPKLNDSSSYSNIQENIQFYWNMQQWYPSYDETNVATEEEIIDAMNLSKLVISSLENEDVDTSINYLLKCRDILTGSK